MKTSVFSISRFFYGKKKLLPCWIAGRFYSEDWPHYHLKSQGLSLSCKALDFKTKPKKGDWIAVQFLSKEKNIYQTTDCRILSPNQGISGSEDFSYENKGKILQDWQSFLTAVKNFFYSEGLAYAETPGLVSCPGTEPHLKVFETVLNINKLSKKMYLPTSPEMHLKKLLCQDWTDFFEIKRCYRNGELSSIHQAELTLLEWYRAFYSTKDLIEESYRLISFLEKEDFFKIPLLSAKIFTVQDLFKKYLNFSLHPDTSQRELFSLLKSLDLPGSPEDSFEDLFFLIFLNKIEPKIPKSAPVFICNYPPQLRAFAQLNSDGWADRFELYWQGMELANAFFEVTDPEEQKQLFEEHLRQRKDNVPFDEELVSLMKRGFPPVSGIALGLDRLFLVIYKQKNLRNTRLFPL